MCAITRRLRGEEQKGGKAAAAHCLSLLRSMQTPVWKDFVFFFCRGCFCTQTLDLTQSRVFSSWWGSHAQRNDSSPGISASNDSSASFESLSMKTPTSNCPCNAYQRCQSQLERKVRAIFPLQREQKMEERRGDEGGRVSQESSADGFISKFKNTDRRDEGGGACSLTGACNVSVHRIHALWRLTIN